MKKVKLPTLHPNFLLRNRPKLKVGSGDIVSRIKKAIKPKNYLK